MLVLVLIQQIAYLWEAVEEEHEGLGLVPRTHTVEFESISSHVLMSTQRQVLQALGGNWRKERWESEVTYSFRCTGTTHARAHMYMYTHTRTHACIHPSTQYVLQNTHSHSHTHKHTIHIYTHTLILQL